MAIMEPVPAEIAIVRDLFAGFTGGASMRELLRDLKRPRGCPRCGA